MSYQSQSQIHQITLLLLLLLLLASQTFFLPCAYPERICLWPSANLC
jgi:hypothetical protein